MTERGIWLADAAQGQNLATFVERVLRLDEAAVVRVGVVRGVRGVGRRRQSGDRGGEVDDRAARTDPPGGLAVDHERAADVGAVHPVQVVEVELGHRRKHHHAGRVHDHVDAAELLLRGVEEPGDGGLVGLIGRAGARLRVDRPNLSPRHRVTWG